MRFNLGALQRSERCERSDRLRTRQYFNPWGYFPLCHGTSRPVGARHSQAIGALTSGFIAKYTPLRSRLCEECLAPTTTPDDTPPA